MRKYIKNFDNIDSAKEETYYCPTLITIGNEDNYKVFVESKYETDTELLFCVGDTLDDFKLIEKPIIPNYLCFTAQQNGSSIKMVQQGTDSSAYDLQVSYDGENWEQYTLGNTITLNNGEKVYWRGNNDHFGLNSPSYNPKCKKFVMSGKIATRGNINSLLSANDFESIDTIPSNYCYSNMFSYCTSLTTAPELPATTLDDYCYSNMFQGCSSLTTVPELPATALTSNCYSNMFSYCTSLTAAPELPATTLADYCYFYMFNGCSSLTTAPSILPAMTLDDYCYYYMFQGCTSLTAAPELPATTLARNCYSGMFSNCSSLTAAPELPAMVLTSSCYNGMFGRCTSLTTAPKLPATTLVGGCYQAMFSGCTSLTTAPELPATTLVSDCYYYMFNGCTKLSYIKAMFTDWGAIYCLNYWVDGVASNGTFVKNAASTFNTRGENGIPDNWTIETANN